MSCRASPLLAPSRRVEISPNRRLVTLAQHTRSPSDSPHRRSQWSSEEEDALRRGVEKYGSGKWRFIQKDAHLSKILHQRSNVDLKVRRSPARNAPLPSGRSDETNARPPTRRASAKHAAPLTRSRPRVSDP